jgi:hypothetical protein
MPWWGILFVGLGAWVVLSVVLGVVIGHAVKVAETHRKDAEFVRTLARPIAEPPRVEARPAQSPPPDQDVVSARGVVSPSPFASR